MDIMKRRAVLFAFLTLASVMTAAVAAGFPGNTLLQPLMAFRTDTVNGAPILYVDIAKDYFKKVSIVRSKADDEDIITDNHGNYIVVDYNAVVDTHSMFQATNYDLLLGTNPNPPHNLCWKYEGDQYAPNTSYSQMKTASVLLGLKRNSSIQLLASTMVKTATDCGK